MARKRSTAAPIIGSRREAVVVRAPGESVANVARRRGGAEQTSDRWRREYGGVRVDQAKRLKERERENVRREDLVADQALDNAVGKEGVVGKFCARRAAGSGTPPGCRRTRLT